MTPGGESAAAGIGGPRFELATAGRIVFGAGSRAGLPALVAGLGRRVLWVGGANPRRHDTLFSAVARAVETMTVLAVLDEPTVAGIEEGVALARRERCDVVVAVGGGSAIDAAKAVAVLTTNPGSAFDYLEVVGRGQPLRQAGLPLVAVPTTAGTGAETTRNAVLTVPEARVKVSLRGAFLFPRVALVDPELACGLAPGTTAATGLDALTQLIEPLVCNRANPLSDALCRDGIARVARALPVAMREPLNVGARAELALGAFYSGIALTNAGLGAVHGLAAPLGGWFHAPHGAVCAALLPHVLRVNLRALRERLPASPVLARFDEVSRLLTGNAAARADDGPAWCAALNRELGIPPLETWGVREVDLAPLAEKALVASSMKANPLPLTTADLIEVLAGALAA